MLNSRAIIMFLAVLTGLQFLSARAAGSQDSELADQVEIRRTGYGVPHILAESLEAAFFGLAYCQLEDYGENVVENLIRSRGILARYRGVEELDSDYLNAVSFRRAVETYHLQKSDVREVFRGFAAGVNAYVEGHAAEFRDWGPLHFTGHDVAALWIGVPDQQAVARFLDHLRATGKVTSSSGEDGSNAWAFAPSRTRSGKTILLRNPHLSWNAGYYEAHLTVPGVINFYGDFRIGYPLFYNGGFNDYLGWATTNNYPDLEEIYALQEDPQRSGHYLFDGGSVPLRAETMTLEFTAGKRLEKVVRAVEMTPLGPVIHRERGRVYVVRSAEDGVYRKAEQFLRMMQARSLEEWKQAMRIRAQTGSNFTYADRDGNIFYLWNAAVPELPLPSGRDGAVPASTSDDIWVRLVPFDRLPQVLNPAGGYLQNANDPFHYANLSQVLDSRDFPENFPEPNLRLRSQLSLQLIQGVGKLTLEDVLALKHNARMLLADRVKPDLVEAVRASDPAPEVEEALRLVDSWDNTAGADSRGALLFETWWTKYFFGEEGPDWNRLEELWDSAFAVPWSAAEPLATPRGLSHPQRAVEAFGRAVDELKRRYGRVDVPWGEVCRVRRGRVDVPVEGCPSWLGCFRALSFEEQADGKKAAVRGDAWVLAVEFTDPPRAYSILAYGQSSKEDSPYFDDQAEMFAAGRMKKVAFSEAEIENQLTRRYRPGRERSAGMGVRSGSSR